MHREPIVRAGLGLALAAALSPLAAGCSWLAMTPPPERPIPNAPLDCSDSLGGPLLDLGGATLLGISAGAEMTAKTASGTDTPSSPARIATGAALGLVALVYGVSMINGLHVVSDCRAARRLNGACMAGSWDACAALSPGWRPGHRDLDPWRPGPPSGPPDAGGK